MGGSAAMNTPSGITKELLETVLGEPIQDYQTREGSNEGDNVASVLTSVVVTTQAQTTHHLLFKSFPDVGGVFRDEASRARAVTFFTTEHLFYRTVVSLFKSIIDTHLNEKLKSSYSLPIATYFHNGLDPADPNNISTVWVNDLRPEGYKMLDKFQGYTLDETELILSELGKFHAISYMMVRQFGEKLFDTELNHMKLNGWLKPEIREEWSNMFAGHWKNVLKLLASQGRPDWVDRLKKFEGHEIFDLALQSASKTDKKYFPILVHGDLWTNNILMKFDTNGSPTAVKFVDFQLSRRGNIYEELVYFIYCSTTPEFRTKHLTNVLCTYYKAFTNFLEALGCPRPIFFTLGNFLDEFDANRISGYMYMTFAIPLQLSTFTLAEEGPSGGKESEPPAEEADETQTPFVKMLYNMIKNSPPALQRLEDITDEMAEANVL